ncbi:MAG TPA: rhomboid family intramembrane serine protease [Candidatus Ozemobacteraceae bacterium]|nr:rhomboid family intramembrane serine protease [Candidatus Ozemobacteraceae bacterium]
MVRPPVGMYALILLFCAVFAFQMMLFYGESRYAAYGDRLVKKSAVTRGASGLPGLMGRFGLVPRAFMSGGDHFIFMNGEQPISVAAPPFGYLGMLFTHLFLHAGLLHLIANLWFFWIFSDNVEERVGTALFLFLFLGTGAAGGLAHVLIQPDSAMVMVGASGGVAGVMGAYTALFPMNRVTTYFCPVWFFIRRLEVPAWMMLGVYILFQILALYRGDMTSARVAFEAHIAGFATGVLIGIPFRNPARGAVGASSAST